LTLTLTLTIIVGLEKSQQAELDTKKKLRTYMTRVRKYLEHLCEHKQRLADELAVERLAKGREKRGPIAFGKSMLRRRYGWGEERGQRKMGVLAFVKGSGEIRIKVRKKGIGDKEYGAFSLW
jgi:hypothetical protein